MRFVVHRLYQPKLHGKLRHHNPIKKLVPVISLLLLPVDLEGPHTRAFGPVTTREYTFYPFGTRVLVFSILAYCTLTVGMAAHLFDAILPPLL